MTSGNEIRFSSRYIRATYKYMCVYICMYNKGVPIKIKIPPNVWAIIRGLL